jgi:hypothetical protein
LQRLVFWELLKQRLWHLKNMKEVKPQQCQILVVEEHQQVPVQRALLRIQMYLPHHWLIIFQVGRMVQL